MKDMQRKAREEAIKVLGDEPQDVFPTLEQTREFPYINMIIKEVCTYDDGNESHLPLLLTNTVHRRCVSLPQ